MSFENLIRKQQSLLKHPPESVQNISPFFNVEKKVSDIEISNGKKLIDEGKVGCLLVAGGQGTRLEFSRPKGTFPLDERGTTLFQIFSEQIASSRCPLAIMTSNNNHEETLRFFKQQNFFGIPSNQIAFFSQKDLPLLDREGNPFLETASEYAVGPNGNGDCFQAFYESEIWKRWNERGVELVSFIQVDNALANPLDAKLIGFHVEHNSEVSLRCILRESPDEKVGVLANVNGSLRIIEYTEFPRDQPAEKYPFANISYFSFSMPFLKKMAKIELPLHLAFKSVNYLNAEGKTVRSEEPMAWKFETFVFDCLPYATKVSVLLSERKNYFSPLKNREGEQSPETVGQALKRFDIKEL